MKIEHIAIWVQDLELMKSFYQKYFNLISGEKYINEKKQLESYFLTFEDGQKTRIELMYNPEIIKLNKKTRAMISGLTHFAISVQSKEKVDKMTNQLKQDGYKIIGNPRTTGDGYYESVVEDPEGNRVEITI